MGKEYKAKGVDVALAPVIGPLGRVVQGGRAWVRYANRWPWRTLIKSLIEV